MNGPGLMEILLGILPMLLLIGAWYLFMRKYTGSRSVQGQCLEEMKAQSAALERIAAALEKRD